MRDLHQSKLLSYASRVLCNLTHKESDDEKTRLGILLRADGVCADRYSNGLDVGGELRYMAQECSNVISTPK